MWVNPTVTTTHFQYSTYITRFGKVLLWDNFCLRKVLWNLSLVSKILILFWHESIFKRFYSNIRLEEPELPILVYSFPLTLLLTNRVYSHLFKPFLSLARLGRKPSGPPCLLSCSWRHAVTCAMFQVRTGHITGIDTEEQQEVIVAGLDKPW